MRPKVLCIIHEKIGWYLPCHGSGGYSSTTHHGDPGSIPVQPMRDFWWKKWPWVRFFSEYCGLSRVIVIPPMPHIHLHLLIAVTRRTNERSLGTFQKTVLFRKPWRLGQKCTVTYSPVKFPDVSKMITSGPESYKPDKPTKLSSANYGSCAL